MPIPHNESLGTARFWREFSSSTTPALGTDIDLSAIDGSNGRGSREVVMLAAGALHVENADGIDCSIATSLGVGTRLAIEVATIKAAQTAAILVLW
jgi:hypothetical protein